jgi:hypothetical protein
MKAIAAGHGNRRPLRDWDRPVRQSVDRRAPAMAHNRTKTGDARVPAAGTYTLQVNGAHVEFHLINHANGFRIEPDPGPLPSSPPMP